VDGSNIGTDRVAGCTSDRTADSPDRGPGWKVGGRSPIRPVVVDESGRLFEMTGEQIVMPGLEPEAILESLEDARAGRMRSLKDIRASRCQHGI
jgi:hypothetical protein